MTTYSKPPVIPAWCETGNNPADLITMVNADIQAGWPNTGTPPSRQRFNFLLNWATNGLRYLMQRGLVAYDAAETYQLNARLIGDDGNSYVSLQNANTAHTPSSSPTWWAPWGFTIPQINASQLTQTTQTTGDSTTKVSTTAFVANGLAALASTVATSIANAISTAEAYVTAGFTISLASNGYIKLPTWASGLMFQWMLGSSTISTGAGRITATDSWPTPFPSGCYAAFPAVQLSSFYGSANFSGASLYVQPITSASVISAYCDHRGDGDIDFTYHIRWFGIGH